MEMTTCQLLRQADWHQEISSADVLLSGQSIKESIRTPHGRARTRNPRVKNMTLPVCE